MKCIIYLLLSIIEKIEKRNKIKNKKYLKKKDILEYIEPFALFWIEDNNVDCYIKVIRNINFELNSLLENNILFNNEDKLSINKDHAFYIEYKEESLKDFGNIKSINECFMYELYNEELLNKKLNDFCTIEDNQNLYKEELVSMSESSDEDSEEEELEDTYYVCESFTSNSVYFINPSINKCNCLSSYYSKDNKNICKHIKFLKNLSNEELTKINILDSKNKSCTCNYFISNLQCKHVKAFLECLE